MSYNRTVRNQYLVTRSRYVAVECFPRFCIAGFVLRASFQPLSIFVILIIKHNMLICESMYLLIKAWGIK